MYYENYILINIEIPNFEEIKKKYFDNEGSKIVLLNDNYSIQSPFEYFTPVMYVDPDGNFFISSSTLIIGAIVGAFIGAGVGFGTVAYNDYKNHGACFYSDWTSYLGAILGGAIAGVGIGIASVLGAGVGASMIYGYGLVVVHSSMSVASSFLLATGISAITGAVGYTIRTIIDSKENFSVNNLFKETFISAFNGALTFGTGALARYLGYGFTSDFLLNKGFDSILYKSINYLKGFILKKTITLPFKIIYYFLEQMLND